jgi:hypothetical protein
MEDFLVTAHYVLTNTELDGGNDQRLQFVESIKAMEIVKGFNEGTKRLNTGVLPIKY